MVPGAILRDIARRGLFITESDLRPQKLVYTTHERKPLTLSAVSAYSPGQEIPNRINIVYSPLQLLGPPG